MLINLKMKRHLKNPIFYLAVIFLLTLFLRLPSVTTPFLDVDEGINAVIGNTILNGGIPYRDAIDNRGPVGYYIYALIFFLFGKNNMMAIHLALIFLVSIISIILYLICTLIGNKKMAYWVILFFAVFSCSYTPRQMLSFNAEWCALIFSVIGAYLFLRFIFKEKYLFLFLSGLSFGLAFFAKQPSLFDFMAALLFCCFFVYSNKKSIKPLVKAATTMIVGFSTVIIIFVCYFYLKNALNDFWFWSWAYYTKYYVPGRSICEKLAGTILQLIYSFNGGNFLLYIFFITASLITVFRFFNKSKKVDKEIIIDFYLLFWCLFSYLGAAYSGRNFGHYFIMILPPFCIVAGRTLQILFDTFNFYIKSSKDKYPRCTSEIYNIKIFIIVVVISGIIFSLAKYTYEIDTRRFYLGQKTREIPYMNMPQTIFPLTEYIKQNSNEHEKILAWGFVPEIYILSNRMPASRHFYSNFLTGFMFGATEIDTSKYFFSRTWEIFMREIRNNMPIFIVDASVGEYFYYGKYPLSKYKELFVFLNENYIIDKDFVDKKGKLSFRLYKRIK